MTNAARTLGRRLLRSGAASAVLRAIVSNPIQAALVTRMARGVATCGAVEAICRAWTSAPKLKLPI